PLPIVSRCFVERAQQVLSCYQTVANPHPVDCPFAKPQLSVDSSSAKPSLASTTLSVSLLPTIGSPFARCCCRHSNNSVASLRCRSLFASSLHLQRRDRNIVVLKSGKKGKHTFTTAASLSSPSALSLDLSLLVVKR
ncbi:hypothetical protein BHM03_00062953, partial [Ensete ventricosum]